ncbi:DNA invertase Pin-like site-specific DNA recombinase [Bradyrhizobium elkanii]
MKPRAYSYLRMSTDDQLKGDSRRRQLEASKAYAEQHGLELADDTQLEDIGICRAAIRVTVERQSG